MAAPTPVSALVHSSTLVTAGVYLLFRMRPLVYQTPICWLLTVLGCATMLMAGLAAIRETDVKKVVALSTLRQLGVIVATLTAGMYNVGFLHLLSHAYFKALLFVSVGSIIHLCGDFQDLRKVSLGTLGCPLRFSVVFVARMSLCGLPFLRGYYSKDACIESLSFETANLFLVLTFWLATAVTAAYSVRLLYHVGLSKARNLS